MTLKTSLFFGLSVVFVACKKEKKDDVVSDSETNKAPTCTLTAPTIGGGSNTLPHTDTFSATASDEDGTISKVEFYVDNAKVGTDMASPYTMEYEFTSGGNFYIKAVAYDNEGATGTSSTFNYAIGF